MKGREIAASAQRFKQTEKNQNKYLPFLNSLPLFPTNQEGSGWRHRTEIGGPRSSNLSQVIIGVWKNVHIPELSYRLISHTYESPSSPWGFHIPDNRLAVRLPLGQEREETVYLVISFRFVLFDINFRTIQEKKSKIHASGKDYCSKLLLAFPTTESEIDWNRK